MADPPFVAVARADAIVEFAGALVAQHIPHVRLHHGPVIRMDDGIKKARIVVEVRGAVAGDPLARGGVVHEPAFGAAPVLPVVGEVGNGSEADFARSQGVRGLPLREPDRESVGQVLEERDPFRGEAPLAFVVALQQAEDLSEAPQRHQGDRLVALAVAAIPRAGGTVGFACACEQSRRGVRPEAPVPGEERL